MKKLLISVLTLVMIVAMGGMALAQVSPPKVVEADTIGRYGGELRVAGLSDPRSFNYMLAQETSTTDVLTHIHDGLVEISGLTTEVEPGLAHSWDFSDDGLVWTFYLREGVQWHDGEEFTADDVIFTFDLVYDEDIPNNFRDSLTIGGEPLQYRKIDRYTVEFTLPEVLATLLRQITTPIMPEHVLGDAWREGRLTEMWGVDTPPRQIIGTGPFQMVEYRPGERIVFTRNPNYWKVDAEGNTLPYMTRFVRRISESLETMSLMFQAGETDTYGVRGAEVDQFQDGAESGNYTVYDGGPTFGTNFVVFNQNRRFVEEPKVNWFNDVNFRRAVAHSIDKEAIVQSVYAGRAYPQDSPVSTPNRAFLNEDVRKYPYDLDQAAALLAESGFQKGGDGVLRDADGNAVEFNLATNAGNTERESIGTFLQEDLAELGMRVNFDPMDFNLLVNQLTSGEGWDAIIIGLTGGVDPPVGTNVFRSSGGLHMWNFGWDEPQTDWEARVDELVDAGLTTLDMDERRAIYNELQEIIAEQVPLAYTVAPAAFYAVRNTVQNADPTAYGGTLHNLEALWINR